MKLEVKNLEKKFKNFTAVKNIDFHIDNGQTLGVLGPNGCGKTTTIGMLLGLIKPSNGKILIDDENFENLNREKIFTIRDGINSIREILINHKQEYFLNSFSRSKF